MVDEDFQLKWDRLLALLKRYSFVQREVTLTSGKKSNFYIDCRRTALTAEGHFLSGWLFNHILQVQYPKVEAVGGMTMGADPLVSATSLMSHFSHRPLQAFYVRKEAKKHGTANWVEAAGSIGEGTRVAILEDVITTGGSTLKAIERVQAEGYEVCCVLCLVDRQEEGGAEAVSKRAPLKSLFTRNDFNVNGNNP